MPQGARQPRLAVEALQRLIHGPFEHLVDPASLELDLEDLLLEPLPLAHLARHEHVGEKHHLDQHVSRALTRFTPAACDVERERAGRVAARARQRLGGEQAAQLVERLDVGHRVRPRRSADGRLIDQHHVGDRLPPFEGVHGAHRLAQVLLRRVGAGEAGLELAKQDVVHER